MNTVREGKSGTKGEGSTDLFTLPCIKQAAGEKLLYNRELILALCDNLEGWTGGGEGGSRGR